MRKDGGNMAKKKARSRDPKNFKHYGYFISLSKGSKLKFTTFPPTLKTNMFEFNKNYFALTILLFVVEVLIALYVHDSFFRPYFGDFLVVIFLYCFLKTLVNITVWRAAIIVLLFSFFVEFTQYLNLITLLGLQKSGLAKAVLGTSFSWDDLVCYTAGIFVVIFVEKGILKNPS